MSTTRRDFFHLSLLAGIGLLTPGRRETDAPDPGRASKSLRLLVLGGTGLIGPPMVEHAIARGHEVTLFNRGKTNTHLFPDLEKLEGDRNGDLQAIETAIEAGRRWDAVIDNSASIPRWVTASAGLTAESAKIYLFTSSLSAYAGHAEPHSDESAPLGTISPEEEARVEGPQQITGTNYGPLKARCEEEARSAFPDRAIVVRPGLIVGPGDYSDRFTYWPVRIERGGEVLAPGEPSHPVQFIDCRDLGEWYVRLVEDGAIGTYNAIGPRSAMTIGGLLHGIRAGHDNEISFTWVDSEFLQSQQVAAWQEMTVWVPPVGDYAGFGTRSNERAIAAGLDFRPLAQTARDTLTWWNALPEERRARPRAGLAPDKETKTLAAWHARSEPAESTG